MAFTPDTFSRLGTASTNAPGYWVYATADNVADLLVAGYFDLAAPALRAGDFITVNATDGATTLVVASSDGQTAIIIAKGSPTTPGVLGMTWAGPWQDGQTYGAGSVVTDLNWLMIALQDNNSRPAPQPLGDEKTSLSDTPGFSTSSQTAVMLTGHNYQFIEAGWVRRVRVWVPTTGPNYSFNLRLSNTQFGVTSNTSIPLTNLTPGIWNEIPVTQQIVSIGTIASIILETTNSSATTQFSGGWTYDGTSANNPPASQRWNRNNGHTLLRLDKDDASSTDRSADLASITADTIVRLTQDSDPARFHEYNVQDAGTDQGAYYEFTVIQVNSGSNVQANQLCTVDVTIPTPSATDYAEIDAYDWTANQPSFATVTGTAATGGGVNLPVKFNNAFGVDIFFQEAQTNSADWGFMAFTQIA